MWLQSVSGHRLFFLLVVGYLGESPFFFSLPPGPGGYWLIITVVPGC
jgi:hypothetical protein